jgi:hypothetical protein
MEIRPEEVNDDLIQEHNPCANTCCASKQT